MSGPYPTSIPPFPGLSYISSQRITDFSAAVGLTPPAGAAMALVSVEAGNLRYSLSGVAPTASVGTPIYGTAQISLALKYFSVIKFINYTGTTSAATIDYYG